MAINRLGNKMKVRFVAVASVVQLSAPKKSSAVLALPVGLRTTISHNAASPRPDIQDARTSSYRTADLRTHSHARSSSKQSPSPNSTLAPQPPPTSSTTPRHVLKKLLAPISQLFIVAAGFVLNSLTRKPPFSLSRDNSTPNNLRA